MDLSVVSFPANGKGLVLFDTQTEDADFDDLPNPYADTDWEKLSAVLGGMEGPFWNEETGTAG